MHVSEMQIKPSDRNCAMHSYWAKMLANKNHASFPNNYFRWFTFERVFLSFFLSFSYFSFLLSFFFLPSNLLFLSRSIKTKNISFCIFVNPLRVYKMHNNYFYKPNIIFFIFYFSLHIILHIFLSHPFFFNNPPHNL